jgi:hypothetical protein
MIAKDLIGRLPHLLTQRALQGQHESIIDPAHLSQQLYNINLATGRFFLAEDGD